MAVDQALAKAFDPAKAGDIVIGTPPYPEPPKSFREHQEAAGARVAPWRGSTPKGLAAKLLEAQKAVGYVEKTGDFRSEKVNYAFARADVVVDACRQALHKAGLVVFRRPPDFEFIDWRDPCVQKPDDEYRRRERAWVHLTYTVTDPATGETEHHTTKMLAEGGKGQSLQKAMLGAVTSGDSYFYVGLLQVPRFDADEISARRPTEDEPKMNPAEVKLIVDGLGKAKRKPEQLGKRLLDDGELEHGINDPAEPSTWPRRLLPSIMAKIEKVIAEEEKKAAKAPKPAPGKDAAAGRHTVNTETGEVVDG